jgi:hypothetical protein
MVSHVRSATASNVTVRVCTVTGTQTPTCTTSGTCTKCTTASADPEGATITTLQLKQVDVEFTVTPIIPGTAFNVVLPGDLKFHRKAVMRNLY